MKETEKKKLLEGGKSADEVSNMNFEDYSLLWEKLTHATLLIGWGFDEKTKMKYWLVRNSYGLWWGDKGNFRLRRGMNDYGAESDNVTGIPIIL